MREAEPRAVILGEYIFDTGATVRATAKVFKISKSTVHNDISKKLKISEITSSFFIEKRLYI